MKEPNMGKLDGKVALVTGASQGMGLASARLFTAEGATVYITGRRQDALDTAVKQSDGALTGIRADSGRPEELDRVFTQIATQAGRLDVVFANAGWGNLQEPIEVVTPQSFRQVFAVNTLGSLLTVQKALPLFGDGGSIILNGAANISRGFPGAGIYAASKAANRSLVRTWAAELRGRNIRVNILSPGAVHTTAAELLSEPMREFIVGQVPLGRFGEPAELAAAALFLASDDSSFITGSELAVDGGLAQV
jgi:NAD(P)-dependent dehydrogenase (short-subunit alcohol dehydrogenase family)